jgi:hypothetical protein
MHVDDVRAQALARDFEAQQRARAVFEEGVDLVEAQVPASADLAVAPRPSTGSGRTEKGDQRHVITL